MKKNKIILEYSKTFEKLNLKNLDDLVKFLDKDIYFEDPFNRIRGRKKFKYIFKRTLKNLKNVNFEVTVITSSKNIFFIKWKMNFFAFKRKNSIIGLSEIIINDENKIISHIDYWDSYNNFFVKIPVIGKFFIFILNIIKLKI